jgi:hypothetical protein
MTSAQHPLSPLFTLNSLQIPKQLYKGIPSDDCVLWNVVRRQNLLQSTVATIFLANSDAEDLLEVGDSTAMTHFVSVAW